MITVVFALERTDSAQNYTVYGVQNEIEYDPTFFEFVEAARCSCRASISRRSLSLTGCIGFI